MNLSKLIRLTLILIAFRGVAAPLVDTHPVCKPIFYMQQKLADVCETQLRLIVSTPSCGSGHPIQRAYFKRELTQFLNESITDWFNSHLGFSQGLTQIKSVKLLAVDRAQKDCEAQPRLVVELPNKTINFDLQSWVQPAEMFEVSDRNIIFTAMPYWLYNGYEGTLLVFYNTDSQATHRERKAFLKSLGFDVVAGNRWGWYLLRVPHFIGRETEALKAITSAPGYSQLFTDVKTNDCVGGGGDCAVDVWSAPVYEWQFEIR